MSTTVPKTAKEMLLLLLDKFFDTADLLETGKIASVLSALRGPDNKLLNKRNTTTLVRAAAFPLLTKRSSKKTLALVSHGDSYTGYCWGIERHGAVSAESDDEFEHESGAHHFYVHNELAVGALQEMGMLTEGRELPSEEESALETTRQEERARINALSPEETLAENNAARGKWWSCTCTCKHCIEYHKEERQ